jgi:hypothetical protein
MLPVKTRKKLVGADVFGNQVKCNTNYLCRQYSKNIGNNYKKHPGYEMPFVFEKEFIKVCEVFHVLDARKSGKPEVRKFKNRIMGLIFQGKMFEFRKSATPRIHNQMKYCFVLTSGLSNFRTFPTLFGLPDRINKQFPLHQ